MSDKLGTYVTKLMTIIVDKDEEQFNQGLAWDELKRLNSEIESFLRKHATDDTEEIEKTKKQLLQEEKSNGKNR